VAHSVKWSEGALRDVEALAEYIARDSEAYARTVVQRIFGVGYRLQQFPFSGRVVPEFRAPTIREFLVYSYRVIYHASASTATVIAVIHGRQDLSGADDR
jgi:plasmid stabilization system protein ParE